MLVIPQEADLRDVPLSLFPSSGTETPALALFLTGDGGWAALDTHVAKYLAAHGVPVAGVNMRSYLWKARTPDSVALDMSRVLRHYLAEWHRDRIAIVGYSRGADIAPFIATRLAPDLRARISLVAMLGLAPNASFQFHLIDLVRNVKRVSDVPTAPELEKLRGTPMLCMYGIDEDDSACRTADSTLVTRVAHPGGHRIDGDYDAISTAILRAVTR